MKRLTYMIYKFSLILIALFLSACQDEKPQKNYDGKQLLTDKCSSCHNLDMPPKTSVDEKAPPIMAVSFHIRDFIKVSDESQKIPKSIEFVTDYALNPSAEKSFCDKESLKSYGVMPSQKGKVSEDELKAIATYMFQTYTPENLAEASRAKAELAKMPSGQRLALKYKCLSCHRVERDVVGPSFENIAKRYNKTTKQIEESIKNGSRKRWESSKGAIMPAHKEITSDELKDLSAWIVGK
jgi:cytochrome c